jgi:hypothetical protein
VDDAKKARLCELLIKMTWEQRHQLKAIVNLETHDLTVWVCDALVYAGLVTRDGHMYVPTEEGEYLANLFSAG